MDITQVKLELHNKHLTIVIIVKYYLTKIKGSETIKLINMCGFFTISKKNSSIRRCGS